MREGKIDEDILRIVLGNVRVPDKVRGDLLAQHTANLTASERLAKMFRDYGTETVESAYRAILDRSERSMREALAQVPAGTYSFEDHMDDYGPGTPPIRMAVDVTFDGKGEVEFDFSRSSDAVPAAINSYINYTRAYVVFAIKAFCNALEPQTEGQHAADQAQGPRGLVLQSEVSRSLGWPADPADPHLRHHQRRARQGAAAPGDGRLLALVEPQHRRHR